VTVVSRGNVRNKEAVVYFYDLVVVGDGKRRGRGK